MLVAYVIHRVVDDKDFELHFSIEIKSSRTESHQKSTRCDRDWRRDDEARTAPNSFKAGRDQQLLLPLSSERLLLLLPEWISIQLPWTNTFSTLSWLLHGVMEKRFVSLASYFGLRVATGKSTILIFEQKIPIVVGCFSVAFYLDENNKRFFRRFRTNPILWIQDVGGSLFKFGSESFLLFFVLFFYSSKHSVQIVRWQGRHSACTWLSYFYFSSSFYTKRSSRACNFPTVEAYLFHDPFLLFTMAFHFTFLLWSLLRRRRDRLHSYNTCRYLSRISSDTSSSETWEPNRIHFSVRLFSLTSISECWCERNEKQKTIKYDTIIGVFTPQSTKD